MPQRGNLTAHRIEPNGELQEIGCLPGAHRWGPTTADSGLFVRQFTDDGPVLVRFELVGGVLQPTETTAADLLVASPVRQVVEVGGEPAFIVSYQSTLAAVRWSGEVLWSHPVESGTSSLLSAADIDGDARAEIVATAPGERVRTFAVNSVGQVAQKANYEFSGGDQRRSPLLYDLMGDGQLCLVTPGTTDDGHLVVRTHRPDGSLLWEKMLDTRTDDEGTITAWNAGPFLPGPRTAVAISVETRSRYVEGTYLLDGQTGAVLWYKDQYRDGNVVRPFRPAGLMTAYDVDGDGVDEIGMDMLSYMAFLKGQDGTFALRHHSQNIRQDGALYAAQLYNSFVPVFRSSGDENPHWFSPLGHGVFGLMYPCLTDGPWRVEAGYDTPVRVGMVDVDGDASMEVGYALLNDTEFVCRDLWTGQIKWTLSLPTAPNGPVIAADVDGDGKGEFLTGRYCLGSDNQGIGRVRWELPVPLGWGIIADVDGDGLGEIICSSDGKIQVIKSTNSPVSP